MNQSVSVCYSNALIFWITSDMEILFNRIDNRADDMVTKGLIDELKNFIATYKDIDFTKSQFASIGLKQLLPLAGDSCSPNVRDKCIEDLKSVTVSDFFILYKSYSFLRLLTEAPFLNDFLEKICGESTEIHHIKTMR